ncbi:hypothetical protein TruAng_000068 [Truncatella angustata]|nr:hypothetical protein TruAng_000068 [Truncatella angustata]
MTVIWVSRFCRAIKAPETAKRYWNATFGILMVPLVQLAVVPIQIVFDARGINLPASILVMTILTIVMLSINFMSESVNLFYTAHMKGPTDFLGRHMSFGFVASFVMLSKEHIKNATDIPRIAGAFVVTTLLNYIGCYIFAASSFRVEERFRRLNKRPKDNENRTQQSNNPSRPSQRESKINKLADIIVSNGSLTSIQPSHVSSFTVEFVVRTFPLWVTLVILITIGLPIYCAMNYDMPFEAFCFTFIWITAVHFQRYIKSYKSLGVRPKTRRFLAVIFNPVLATSALCTVYFWVKTVTTYSDIGAILDDFKRHNSWAAIMVCLIRGGGFTQNVGAGDLAHAILDAGIVSLGFKMFEHRRELWNSFATVLSTCLVFATLNVFINVILARAMGLRPADALAFCARNVTIALGVPAVQGLEGSTTLMASLVTFSGMLFQMTGDLLFSWLRINDRRPAANISCSLSKNENETEDVDRNEYKVIAAGVTVGINAAAMGTSHLIERDSRSTAYSALSMTLFGAFTVAVTAVPAIADALKMLAAR